MTTVSDPEGRATVMDLLRGVKERVYPVGRLDYHSEGLLLLTNDGDMANSIMSAHTHLPKTYVVKVTGLLTADQEQEFRDGVPLMGRRTLPAGLRLIRNAENPWYEVKLTEGRNNQIRMMFKHFGKLVEKLKRVRIGPLELGPLKPGEFRYLTDEEIEKLKRAIKRSSESESRMNQISEILQSARTIAVVGLSGKRFRPSYGVAEYMQRAGYRIIPVNPRETQVLGETSYPDLDSIPEAIDIVDIFRRSEFVPEIVEAAIRKGAKVIWMQEGVIHEDAARRATEAGLTVVMDRCILKDHRRLGLQSEPRT